MINDWEERRINWTKCEPYWDFCGGCGDMVVCGDCGNNSCHGGYEDCLGCQVAYNMMIAGTPDGDSEKQIALNAREQKEREDHKAEIDARTPEQIVQDEIIHLKWMKRLGLT